MNPKNRTVVHRLLYTLSVLIALRICTYIPCPGINPDYMSELINDYSMLMLFNAMTGNSLSKMSVMAFSITPYISATIIIQLLTIIFSKLEKMQRGTETERRIIDNITYAVTVLIAASESTAAAITFGKRGLLYDYKWYYILLVSVIWTVASLLVALLGKYMQEHKETFIGNGVSLILLSNILSQIPGDIIYIYQNTVAGKELKEKILYSAAGILIGIIAVAFTVFTNNHSTVEQVRFTKKADSEPVPFEFKMCPSSVMPVIFASTVFTIPVFLNSIGIKCEHLAQITDMTNWFTDFHEKVWIQSGIILYVIAVYFFARYYTVTSFNGNEIANTLRRSEAIMGSLAPGEETAEFINMRYHRLLLTETLCLSVISLTPLLIANVTDTKKLSFLGTSLMIITAVITETVNEFKADRKLDRLAKIRFRKKSCIRITEE